MFTNVDPVSDETDSIYLEMIGFQPSHYTGTLCWVCFVYEFFFQASLTVTFQFHCLENKALIHHHMQFTTLVFGRTLFFFLLKHTHTLLQGLLSFESNLIIRATALLSVRNLMTAPQLPEAFCLPERMSFHSLPLG